MMMAVHPIAIGVLLLVFHAVYISGQTTEVNETNTGTAGDNMCTEASTTAAGLESSPGNCITPTTQCTETKEVVNLILVITICILGTALLICIVIIVILRLTSIKKRRISTTPPECDTQPLEVKNEEATSP